MEVSQGEVVLCEFYFSDLKRNKLRPVIVFKNNLPFEDFIGMPISSRLDRLNDDEILIDQSDFLVGELPKRSKVMVRKTFVISKQVIVKKYGTLSDAYLHRLHRAFCLYFQCN